MTGNLQVSALQLRPPTSLEESLEHGLRACEAAKEAGADLVVFPEMWSNGYSVERSPGGHVRFAGQPQTMAGPHVSAYREAAERLGIAVVITYLEEWRGGQRNSAALIDRHGAVRLRYSKVHTCDFDQPECFLTKGESFPVTDLDTGAGKVSVGILICFDREFPESARALARQGAELMLIPNACELEQHRLAQLDARAFENMAAICVANYAAPKNNGHSLLLDGMAFDKAGCSRRMEVFEGGAEEAILTGGLDLEALRRYRKQEPWGVHERR